ncbi:MAG: hypothetical protein AAGF92_04225 [Myxococcota bacterium]
MTRFILPFLLIAFVANAACDGTTKLQREMLDDSTWETSGGEETPWEPAERQPKVDEKWEEENAPPGSSSLMTPRRTNGVIKRYELDEVLDRGLGSYLQNIETEPAFDQGRFVGFRIVKLFPGDLTYASLDLRPGDVVTRVNGRSISRPEQASAVWEALRTASDLTVEYKRGDTDHTMRFAIVDVG